jgi:hypothetical protein
MCTTIVESRVNHHLLGLVSYSRSVTHDIYTTQWMNLKCRSHFYDPSGHVTTVPATGNILRANDGLTMLSMTDEEPVPAVFIRKCYILWFKKFLEAVKMQPMGKFALSSSPGCGKTTANNFIFKMAASDPHLHLNPILYQVKEVFYHLKSSMVYIVDHKEAHIIASLPETFYVIDGHDADPVHSLSLTLFISSPRSTTSRTGTSTSRSSHGISSSGLWKSFVIAKNSAI